jgi:hypothetical protein
MCKNLGDCIFFYFSFQEKVVRNEVRFLVVVHSEGDRRVLVVLDANKVKTQVHQSIRNVLCRGIVREVMHNLFVDMRLKV